ncbi:MAG: hypothetical protein D6681_08155 [Calditrichaeota bacterium]|nr:MAG: hypothetical protein D6681_08155 [Calditrichota bacterium]
MRVKKYATTASPIHSKSIHQKVLIAAASFPCFAFTTEVLPLGLFRDSPEAAAVYRSAVVGIY